MRLGRTDADLVFVRATVEPIARRSSLADAVAVRSGRIAAVGKAADLREQIGPRTTVMDLAGETVLPGFQDAHIHPIDGGLLADRCDVHALASADAYLDAIATYAAAYPDRAWIRGGGWSLTAFPRGEPGRELLDRVVPDRPVILESNDGHVAWANSAALERAGLTPATDGPGRRPHRP